jgi:hypothetical protein
MEENRSARDVGADNASVPHGDDYEYDEAHDAPVGPVDRPPAPPPVNPPPTVNVGDGGDYGYDEAHDFGVR